MMIIRHIPISGPSRSVPGGRPLLSLRPPPGSLLLSRELLLQLLLPQLLGDAPRQRPCARHAQAAHAQQQGSCQRRCGCRGRCGRRRGSKQPWRRGISQLRVRLPTADASGHAAPAPRRPPPQPEPLLPPGRGCGGCGGCHCRRQQRRPTAAVFSRRRGQRLRIALVHTTD